MTGAMGIEFFSTKSCINLSQKNVVGAISEKDLSRGSSSDDENSMDEQLNKDGHNIYLEDDGCPRHSDSYSSFSSSEV